MPAFVHELSWFVPPTVQMVPSCQVALLGVPQQTYFFGWNFMLTEPDHPMEQPPVVPNPHIPFGQPLPHVIQGCPFGVAGMLYKL
jgi:hypothetical protein